MRGPREQRPLALEFRLGSHAIAKRYGWIWVWVADAAPPAARDAIYLISDLSNKHWMLELLATTLTDHRACPTAFNFPDPSGTVIVQNEGIVFAVRRHGL